MTNRFLFILLLSLFLAACSSQKIVPRNSAEQYFQEGEKFFDSKLYEEAIASWEKVRDSYYSPELNMLAELKIAEAYYRSERYEEAATAYGDFLKRHPNDSRVKDVLYRLGLSHYQQILSADRDQTSTRNALQVFEELLHRFPSYSQAEEAGHLIQRCRNRLAEAEVYVGHFYLKRGQYQAAINRLEKALADYPNYYHLDEAYFLLGKAYLQASEKEKAKDTFNQLFEQFPGSEYLIDAQKILAEEY
ncbi:outer membrane protein assembly factor BamD [Malonomonas rubra]|uniref:outer membrane protein assembly factor BamD n=1 Tax=Malonomonas rubra TaxID=57040 RepID=UPI0026E9BFA4|nr:outer membrane protein assembly factor BamD [Malonomonas rubra]